MGNTYNEFYSAIKKNKITAFARKWKDLESIMLSEISQSQKNEGSYVFINMRNLGSSGDTKGTPMTTENPQWYKGRGTREGEG